MILKVCGLNNCWDQLYCYAIKATLNRFNQLCSEDDLGAVLGTDEHGRRPCKDMDSLASMIK